MTPVPESENSHETTPAYVAVPVTVSGTVVPISCPDADPVIEMFPAQLPEKFPDMEFDVALVTCHWKLPQEPGEGTANVSESQVPVVGTGAVTVGAVGERTVVLLSTAQAVANVEAAARAA